jgi:hypothetical protein
MIRHVLKSVRGRYWAAYVFVGVLIASVGASLVNDTPIWPSILVALSIGITGAAGFYLMYRKNGPRW